MPTQAQAAQLNWLEHQPSKLRLQVRTLSRPRTAKPPEFVARQKTQVSRDRGFEPLTSLWIAPTFLVSVPSFGLTFVAAGEHHAGRLEGRPELLSNWGGRQTLAARCSSRPMPRALSPSKLVPQPQKRFAQDSSIAPFGAVRRPSVTGYKDGSGRIEVVCGASMPGSRSISSSVLTR